MTDTCTLDDVVHRLSDLRITVLSRRAALHESDPRTEDIVWPCSTYERVDTVEFDSRNTCLVAEPPASTLWLGRPILEDLVRLLPPRLQGVGSDWFLLHQLVHVSQGLSYRDFRTLNKVGNRHETMRPDCDADYISLKTLALLQAMDQAEDHAGAHIPHLHRLLDDLVPTMIAIDPNIFIPRQRDIEIKRIFALLLLRLYFTRAVDQGHPSPDDSFFPWWSEDFTDFYIFVGQVSTLGRGPIRLDPDQLRSVTVLLHQGEIDTAYRQMSELDWPSLADTAALPGRLTWGAR